MDWFPPAYTHLAMLIMAGLVFHAVLWARNARFLWANRRIILRVVLIAEVWMLITDPIGGAWGAWYFAPDKVLGLWLFTWMPIEDLFGIAVVSSAAACATLVFAYSPRRWI
jgi:lycopene cyclase domain-containing protein